MIFGVGTDICSIERLEKALLTPGFKERIFHPNEQELNASSLAARFAAKEALAKALGDPKLLVWNEIEVQKTESGKPWFAFHGSTLSNLEPLQLNSHLSISHDAGFATAVVVLEAN